MRYLHMSGSVLKPPPNTGGQPIRIVAPADVSPPSAPPALLRPLADYEAAISGGF